MSIWSALRGLFGSERLLDAKEAKSGIAIKCMKKAEVVDAYPVAKLLALRGCWTALPPLLRKMCEDGRVYFYDNRMVIYHGLGGDSTTGRKDDYLVLGDDGTFLFYNTLAFLKYMEIL